VVAVVVLVIIITVVVVVVVVVVISYLSILKTLLYGFNLHHNLLNAIVSAGCTSAAMQYAVTLTINRLQFCRLYIIHFSGVLPIAIFYFLHLL
jgi:hypothetical protein